MNTDSVIKRLKGISIFAEIKNKKNSLEQLSRIIKIEKFKPNSYIIKEGEYGDSMYILNKGTVNIVKKTLSNDSFVVDILHENRNVFFGEIALMDNELRSASVIARTPTECYVIKKKDFEKLCKNNPELGYYIIKEIAKSLSARLRKLSQDNVNLITAIIGNEKDSE